MVLTDCGFYELQMAPYTRTRLALRRRQAANLEPIVVSDDETSQYKPVEETDQA